MQQYYVDAGGRGSGKTTKLVEWVKSDLQHNLLVVRNIQEEKRILGQFKIPKDNVSNLNDLIHGRFKGFKTRSIQPQNIRIDGVQELLRKLDSRITGFSVDRDD